MRIREIEIDRFRIWRNLSLPLEPSGLNVIYGPNEAGKTTIMRFVRSILYGFPEPEYQADAAHVELDHAPWQGSLNVVYKGRRLRIQRRGREGEQGTVQVFGLRKKIPADRVLEKLLGGTDNRVYQDVFSVGLKELQQLATMDSEQVAERIYGMSLGPRGRSLLDAMADVESRRQKLTHPDSGRLATLFAKYRQLSAQDANPGRQREEHTELCQKRRDLESRVTELKRRQTNVESELRGNRFLQRCHAPWNRVRELQSELNGMPLVNELPEGIFDQLDRLEADSDAAARSRDKAQAEADQVKRQVDRRQINAKLQSNSAAVKSLVEQSGWLTEIDERIRATREGLGSLQQELRKATEQLGSGWTAERLEQVDTSPSAQARLMQVARRYQKSLTRRARLRGLNRRLSKASQQELVEHNQQLEALGGRSVDEALSDERRRLTELQTLSRLTFQESELSHRRSAIQRLLERVDTGSVLPEWIDVPMGMIGFSGVSLFVIGLLVWVFGGSMSSAHAALAGAAFGLAGVMWFAFRIGLRHHLDRQARYRRHDLQDEADGAQNQFEKVRSEIGRVVSAPLLKAMPEIADKRYRDPSQTVKLIENSLQTVARLERLAETDERVQSRRRRLSKLRQRFQTAQQELNERRQEWCRTLTDIGLDETVNVGDGFESWQQILEANEIRHRLQSASPELDGLQRTAEVMQEQIQRVGQRIGDKNRNYSRPLEVLSAWKQQLEVLDRDLREREQLQAEESTRRADVAKLQAKIDHLATEHATLLARSGASTRDDLVQHAEWIDLRRELESDLSKARDELQDVASSEPDIALVEDDLVAYDKSETATRIETLSREAEALKQDLTKIHEDLGALRKEIADLESGRSSMNARFERYRVAGDIHRSAEDWCSLQLAERIVNRMREEFEKTSVSDTLALASEQLNSLTQGRYRRIWAPLGKHHLCVDDQYNRTFRVEDLSGGTREQMFLAIRLALVREFADRGIELPVVLDDLFVNFDQTRTEAALDSLLKFSESGSQVLFLTCHMHLAKLFEQRGVRPLWLPGHYTDDVDPVQESVVLSEYDEPAEVVVSDEEEAEVDSGPHDQRLAG